MTRTLTNEQRGELFRVAVDLENPISEIKSYTAVLHLMIEGLQEDMERAAIYLIANEIEKRERQLSEAHARLFHGLHENPRANILNDEVRLNRLLNIAKATGQSLDTLEAQSRDMDAPSFSKWADEQAA